MLDVLPYRLDPLPLRKPRHCPVARYLIVDTPRPVQVPQRTAELPYLDQQEPEVAAPAQMLPATLGPVALVVRNDDSPFGGAADFFLGS